MRKNNIIDKLPNQTIAPPLEGEGESTLDNSVTLGGKELSLGSVVLAEAPDKESEDEDAFSGKLLTESKGQQGATVNKALKTEAKKIMNLYKRMATLATAAKEVKQKAEKNAIKRPRGLKNSINRLESFATVLHACSVIVDTMAMSGCDNAPQALEESKFQRQLKIVDNLFERREPQLKAHLEQLKFAMEEMDEETMDIAKEMKQMTSKMEHDYQELANKLYEATFRYPDTFGHLTLFGMIAEKNNKKEMAVIDSTMLYAGKAVVGVADAPAMKKALSTNDKQAIKTLLSRMIDNMPEAPH